MRTILVTGGAGFIGSHVCERLLKRNDKVISVDNFDDYYDPRIKRANITECQKNSNYTLLEKDLVDYEALKQSVDSLEIDHILHLAARPGVIPSVQDPDATFRNNVIGTQSILRLCRNLEIDRLTLASSSSVYGSRTEGPFRETDNVSTPESPYAASKVMNEAMAHSYHKVYGMNINCLRFFTVYGPRQRPEMAIHTFIRRVLEENLLTVYGSPESARDYTFVDDIVNGILGAIDLDDGFHILNLGNSKPVSLGNLVDTILTKTNPNVEVKWLPGRVGDVPLTFADISKAKDLIGYDPTTNVETGIEKLLEWYKANSSLLNK
ncbi:MAG: GDP-mannose 4,6-dehydratase [Candidatus Thorarchaeota archaeon]|nr:GDP-mannose 4,6-dehydratase [Candidatus Thorarchaeota archaeon]